MNKNNGMFLIRIIGVFLLITTGAFTCQGQTFTPCSITVNEIKINFLHKKIDAFKNPWHPCFKQVRTLIHDEENESLFWNALIFSRNHQKAFVAESNWQNKEQISRITIMDKQIPTTSGVHVGDRFEKIQAMVATTIPTEPDGFLSLRDKNDPDIFYVMNIRGYPKLFFGVDRLSEIPGAVKVESIVVMNSR
jgi:hypothetical protein